MNKKLLMKEKLYVILGNTSFIGKKILPVEISFLFITNFMIKMIKDTSDDFFYIALNLTLHDFSFNFEVCKYIYIFIFTVRNENFKWNFSNMFGLCIEIWLSTLVIFGYLVFIY